MKTTIYETDFIEAMKPYFSREASVILFDHLGHLEADTDTDIELELDPIAINCEYQEYTSINGILQNYANLFEAIDETHDRATQRLEAITILEEHTTVLLGNDGTIVIQEF
jgi:hypothetical protein